MRAIDADALLEFIKNRYDITWKDDYEGGIRDACTDITEKINKMPTIEPERKTGKWNRISLDKYTRHAEAWYRCDQCGETYIGEMNYCGNCGTKMEANHEN